MLFEDVSSLPVLDRVAAVDAMGGDEAMFDTFIELFLDESKNQAEAIELAILENDSARLERAAHSLKGAAATMHVERVSEIANRLEMIGRSSQLSNAPALFDQLNNELQTLNEYVKTL